MRTIFMTGIFVTLIFQTAIPLSTQDTIAHAGDIGELTEHFIEPGADLSPWMFVPENNIQTLSTKSNPGYLKIHEAGKGQDVKGILEKPIRIDDYPLPWEFQLGFLQDMKDQSNTFGQANYAFGLNVVVTFSDPKTWPKDRTQTPPDARSVQLLVVHLGNVGEGYIPAVPLVRRSELNWGDPSPEVYLLYGRGDLHPDLVGNWKMPYSWVGPDSPSAPNLAGAGKEGGPADHLVRFQVSVNGPTSLTFGFGSGSTRGWRTCGIGTGEHGPITGIWEIGPIISADRWISDVLADELDINEPPGWLQSLKLRYDQPGVEQDPESLEQLESLFDVQPPHPDRPYYVDYAVFIDQGNLEHYSEEFDIPGYHSVSKFHIEGNILPNPYVRRGYLTLTAMGNKGGWAICPATSDRLNFVTGRKPPFEVEISMIPPSSDQAWNLWWNIGLENVAGDEYYTWQPTFKNIPGVGFKYLNTWLNNPRQYKIKAGSESKTDARYQVDPTYPMDPDRQVASLITPTFAEDPQHPADGEPIFWILQAMDDHRVRVGYKLKKEDPWIFSSEFDTTDLFGKIGRFGYPALVCYQLGQDDMGVGNYPDYQQYYLDYIRFRFALSE